MKRKIGASPLLGAPYTKSLPVDYGALETRVMAAMTSGEPAPDAPKKKRRSKPKRYSRGKKFETLHELIDYLNAGNTYVMWNDRPCHSSWIISMQFRTVEQFVKAGRFYRAVDSKVQKTFLEKAHVSYHPQDDKTHRCGHPDCSGFDPELA